MTTLPAAPWTQREDLAALVAALDPAGEGLCRWVGGAVRDTLLGLPVKDIDMATCCLRKRKPGWKPPASARCPPASLTARSRRCSPADRSK